MKFPRSETPQAFLNYERRFCFFVVFCIEKPASQMLAKTASLAAAFALQVQQQAALMASVGQGGYLSPMAAFAAAQMQHMATINGLPGAPLTPTSGKAERGGGSPAPSLSVRWVPLASKTDTLTQLDGDCLLLSTRLSRGCRGQHSAGHQRSHGDQYPLPH